jgi:hypothetical protein
VKLSTIADIAEIAKEEQALLAAVDPKAMELLNRMWDVRENKMCTLIDQHGYSWAELQDIYGQGPSCQANTDRWGEHQ